MIGHSTSRACVFINSNNPSMPSQLINSPTPLIRPPFPPTIDPHDLISPVNTTKDSKVSKDSKHSKHTKDSKVKDDLKNKKLRTRAPNAFIIYRKVFIETARSQGYYLPMTVISSMASQSWEKENEVVKSEYRRLAREAFNIHCEMLPKSFSPRRRKREKWNIISFEEQQQDNNNNINNNNNNNNSYVRTKKEELPGFYSWNSRSITEPCIEHVTFSNPVLSSPGSPEISNNILLKERYNPALKLPPLIPSNSKNHAVHTSLPKLFKPVISSKIRLLLNDDDE